MTKSVYTFRNASFKTGRDEKGWAMDMFKGGKFDPLPLLRRLFEPPKQIDLPKPETSAFSRQAEER